MIKHYVIDVGEDFSKIPQGRNRGDSNNSAKDLFIIMHDLLEEGFTIELQFHNTLLVGSCFLHELAKLTVANGFLDKVSVTKGLL